MKVTVKKLAPSIKNHVNRGGNFKSYRHDFTNYDLVIKKTTPESYKVLAVELAKEMLAGSSNEKWVAEVKEWVLRVTQ